MSDQRSDRANRNGAADSTAGFGPTANRRDVLRTATGLVAAAAVGGAFLATGDEAAAAPTHDRIVVKFDGFDRPFEALTMQHNIGATVSTDGGGRRIGRPEFSDMGLTKRADAYTTQLQSALARGILFDKVEIRFIRETRRSGLYELKNVLVTSYSLSYDGGNPFDMIEAFSLNFEEIKVTFAGTTYQYNLMTATTT